MTIAPVQSCAEATVSGPSTMRAARRVRLTPLTRQAAAHIIRAATAAHDWLNQHDLSVHSVAEHVTSTWWTGMDWATRQPFEWAVTRARLEVLGFRWDLDGRADRLQAWACALEALAHSHRALRDHPDVPEEDGLVEQLENQAVLLRAIATADRARFLRAQAAIGPLPDRCLSAPNVESLIGSYLDELSCVSTSQDQRLVILAQMKVLLAPTFGEAAVQVLHDIY